MIGILPIAKYSSASELNMFLEYTMALEERFSIYFGFLQNEVDELYRRYLKLEFNPRIALEDLGKWYDGYHTFAGDRVYNPRSVVVALTNNNLGNYWTSAGPYDEIFYYIKNNVNGEKDDLARMITGDKVRCEAKEYAATSMNLKTRDEILSAMVVYGFLSYADGFAMIPNQELMGQFADMLEKSGKGFVDFIFYPRRKEEPGIILEFKVDDSADNALKQIKDKNYIQRFKGKVAGKQEVKEVILVGISYDKVNKKHT